MVTKYTRRDELIYPQVYHTFKAQNLKNDELVEYSVEDLTSEHVDRALELQEKYLFPDEVFNFSARIHEKPHAVKAFQELFREAIKERISLACFDAKSRDLVGVNFMIVKTRGIKESYDLGHDVNSMIEAFDYVDCQFDAAEHFNVDHYLYGAGLVVKSEYRGRGIASQMLKARVPFMKCLGLTVTSTVFTMLGSQKAAVNAGFKETVSISFNEIQTKFPHLDFSSANTSHCKILALKI